jgi:hypothetical protein
METGTVIVLGAVGVGAFLVYRRMKAQPQPAITADPTSAAAMTSSGARQTQVGGTLRSGIVMPAPEPRTVLPGISTGISSFFRSTVARLVVAQANPVPIPPPPPSAGSWAGTAVPAPAPSGASTMGTNPKISFTTNTSFYKGIL